jgi:MFS family permease
MLYFISWLTDCALFLFIFSGTRFLAEREASPWLLGALGASFFLASAITNANSGRVADRVGRRPVSLCGAAMLLASLAGVAWFPADSWFFYAAYTSVGVAVGMIYPPIMALLGKGKSDAAASRALLLFCLAFNMGIVSGQLSGGWMFDWLGPRVPLLVAMGLTVISIVCLSLLRGTETRREATATTEEHADARLARAFVRLTWIANFGGMFSMSILWFLFPILVVALNVHAVAHGAILSVGRVIVMSTYCTMHFLPFWQYRFRIAAIAQATGAVGLLLIAVTNSTAGLALGVAALSLLMGYNYFASLFYSAHGNTNERKGRAFGLNEASLGLGAAGGSFFGGWIGSDLGNRAPFLLAASLVTTLLIIQAIAYWKLVRPLIRNRSSEVPEPTLSQPTCEPDAA